MSTSSRGTPEWGELVREDVELPSGHTVSLRELTADELMSLPEGKESAAVAVGLAAGIGEDVVKAMGARNFIFLTRAVNKMNGIVDGESPLESDTDSE